MYCLCTYYVTYYTLSHFHLFDFLATKFDYWCFSIAKWCTHLCEALFMNIFVFYFVGSQCMCTYTHSYESLLCGGDRCTVRNTIITVHNRCYWYHLANWLWEASLSEWGLSHHKICSNTYKHTNTLMHINTSIAICGHLKMLSGNVIWSGFAIAVLFYSRIQKDFPLIFSVSLSGGSGLSIYSSVFEKTKKSSQYVKFLLWGLRYKRAQESGIS